MITQTNGAEKKEYRNAVRTKRMIREAFVALLDEKKRIERITVGELAAHADIAKSTFYNHYSDIYAVAEEIEAELLENLSMVLDEIRRDHATSYDLYFAEIMQFLKRNEDLYRKVIGAANMGFVIDNLKTMIAEKVFEKSDAFPFSSDADVKYVQIRFITNACVDTMVDYYKGKLHVTLEEVGIIFLVALNKLKQEESA